MIINLCLSKICCSKNKFNKVEKAKIGEKNMPCCIDILKTFLLP